MDFVHNGSSCKVTTKNNTCYILTILSIIGICWSLLLDCASTELICHEKKCVLKQTSLAHRRGFFGTLRGSFQVLFPNGKRIEYFHVDRFQRTLVKEVDVSRKSGRKRYDVYLVMDELWKLSLSGGGGVGGEEEEEEDQHQGGDGGEEIFWNSYQTAAAAEYDAVIIEGSMHRHCEADSDSPPPPPLQRDDDSKTHDIDDRPSSSFEKTKPPPAVHASVDNVSWDELFLALNLVFLYYSIAVYPHSEIIVINQECGVVVVERRTILSSKRQNLLSTTGTGSRLLTGGNVLLLAPVSLVADVESTRHVRRHNGTITVSWGLQMRLRDHHRNNTGSSSSSRQNIIKLRCGTTVSDQRRNDEDASRLRAALRTAGFDGSSSSNSGLGASQLDAAVGLRRAAAFQAENNDAIITTTATTTTDIGQQQRVNNGTSSSSSRIGGGGEPGGNCVVCLEKKARVAFAPCAHVCCCEVCGQNQAFTICPICRSPIVHRIGLYFST